MYLKSNFLITQLFQKAMC